MTVIVRDDSRNGARTFTTRRRSRSAGRWLLPTACALVLATAGAARAAEIHVNTTNTGWPGGMCGPIPQKPCCGIREAIESVNTLTSVGGCTAGQAAGNTIFLDASGTYTATTSLTIERPVTVHGKGVGTTVLRGNVTTESTFLWVYMDDNVTVTFEDLTLDRTTGGSVTGIYAWQGRLNLFRARMTGYTRSAIIGDNALIDVRDSTIENNSSFFSGGGIQHNPVFGSTQNGGLNIERSTIANNSSGEAGGGIYYAGKSNSHITNATITGNSAVDGGGIYHTLDADYLELHHVTVTKNTATNAGGGIATYRGVYMFESIVAANTAASGVDVDGNVPTIANSLIGNATGAIIGLDQGGTLLNISPNLDPVARDLGGPFHLKVHRPFPSSPVFDRITDLAFVPTDQRGVLRPQLGSSNPLAMDLGAFESSRLETEVLAVAQASSMHAVVNGTQYSNAKGTNLQAGSANNFVTYSTPTSVPAGTYNIVIGFKKGNNAGKFQFGIGNSVGGSFTPVGSVQDGYAGSSTWVSVNLNNVTVTAGVKFFRFFVTGQNSNSLGFQVFPDYVDFTRQ